MTKNVNKNTNLNHIYNDFNLVIHDGAPRLQKYSILAM
jgi:hypothetical protein